jgi:hypothetical protein
LTFLKVLKTDNKSFKNIYKKSFFIMDNYSFFTPSSFSIRQRKEIVKENFERHHLSMGIGYTRMFFYKFLEEEISHLEDPAWSSFHHGQHVKHQDSSIYFWLL